MKMLQEGKDVEVMRETINQRYGNFGPSTDQDKGSYLLPANDFSKGPLTKAASGQCGENSIACSQ